ncbi:MAG: NADH-quinone oxidoreductase subunit C [Planctomycetota bacterium]|nr:NADH-quinone oxidoreductase subunit C [Planctomycetota bacterium]
MSFDFEKLQRAVRERFDSEVLEWTVFREQHCLHLAPERIVDVLRFLRDEPAFNFAMLTDVTALDHLKLPASMEHWARERFAVVYHLNSLEHGARLRVKAYVPEEPCEIDSVSGVWASANWGEREVFDMYGIVFRGHPDLRRILTPDHFDGHPLRKDYPLKGRGERDNFPKYTEIPERG